MEHQSEFVIMNWVFANTKKNNVIRYLGWVRQRYVFSKFEIGRREVWDYKRK